jgi:hypothetical protein
VGGTIERTRLQTFIDRLSCLTDSAENAPSSTDLNLPTEVCTGTATTKEQSQRRAFNLIPIMVFNARPTCEDRHAAELIVARRDVLHLKAEYIAADLSYSPQLSLAVLRRTIHYRYQSGLDECIGDLSLVDDRSHWRPDDSCVLSS